MCIRDSIICEAQVAAIATGPGPTREIVALADTNQMMDYEAGDEVGSSRWITIDQSMISDFGRITLDPDPVSYTHLDVYKRQRWSWPN